MTQTDVKAFLESLALTVPELKGSLGHRDPREHETVMNVLIAVIMEHHKTRPLPPLKELRSAPTVENIMQNMLNQIYQESDTASDKAINFQKEKAQVLDRFKTIQSATDLNSEKVNQWIGELLSFFKGTKNLGMVRFLRTAASGVNWSLGTRDQLSTLQQRLMIQYESSEKALRFNVDPVVQTQKMLNSLDKNLKELTQCSLQTHMNLYKKELLEGTESVHIIHFYESTLGKLPPAGVPHWGRPRAAEYLDSYDSDSESDQKISFDKTSHGLGSGVYGVVSHKNAEHTLAVQSEDNSCYQIIEIQKPLRLKSRAESEAEQWSTISKDLQRLANQVKQTQYESIVANKKLSRQESLEKVLNLPDNHKLLTQHAATIACFKALSSGTLTVSSIQDKLVKALGAFFKDAKKTETSRIVPMPINYLIQSLGFTGVVSTENDLFNRGLILTDKDSIEALGWLKIAIKKTAVDTNDRAPAASSMSSHPLGGEIMAPIPPGAAERHSPSTSPKKSF